MRLGGIYVDVAAKTAKLKRDLAKAETMSQRTALRMQHHLSNINFKAVGVAAAAFAATFAYGMKKAIDVASDLEETASKFGVVFAGQTELAAKNAKILNESFAMSREESMRYLASVQDLLVPMGVAADKAAKLSHEVVKLSADLGSFNNMPTERVMLDIQSALVGNFETMKKYGVVLKETVVSEKALAMGLAETKKELTAGHKAQAAYALMVEGSAAAIGDMDRTSESYANQVKKLNANLSDLTAEIGKELLPFATDIIKSMNAWLEVNGEFMKTNIVGFIQGIGIALEVLLEPLRLVVEMFRTLPELLGRTPQLPAPPNVPWSQADPSGVASSAGVATPEVMAGEAARLEEHQAEIRDMKAAELEWLLMVDQEAANKHKEMLDAKVAAEREAENQIISLKEQSARVQQQLYAAMFTTVLQIAGVKGKQLFALQKAFEVGQTIMHGLKAEALAIATIPPPAGIVVGAGLKKLAFMNAALIGATAIGQLSAPSGSTGGGTYTSPTVTTEAATVTEQARGTLTINIQGDFIGDEAYIDLLVERINQAEDRDVYINQTNYAVETL